MAMTYPLACCHEPVMWSAPISTAVRSGNVELVDYLLKQGAQADVRDALFDTPLHLSCKIGDSELAMSKRIYESCKLMERDGETKWIVGLQALNKNELAVLDRALVAEDGNETVSWLIDLGAKSTVDVVSVLEKEAEEQRENELLRRKQEEQEEQEEQEDLEQNQRYAFIMMDKLDGEYDPAVRQIRKDKIKQARSEKSFSAASGFRTEVFVIQACLRRFLARKMFVHRMQAHERSQEARKVQLQMRRRDEAAKRREAKSAKAAERKYADEKKKAEDNKIYAASTSFKYNSLNERLQAATKARVLVLKKIASEQNEDAIKEAKEGGIEQNTDFEAFLDGSNAVGAGVFGDDSKRQSQDGMSTPATRTRPTSDSDRPLTVEDFQKRIQKTQPKKSPKKVKSPSLKQVHENMRRALAEKQAKEAARQIERAEIQSREFEHEAELLARKIAEVEKNRIQQSADDRNSRIALELRPDQIRAMTWFYIDLDGNRHGPYLGPVMAKWTQQGFFDGDVQCGSGFNGPFYRLRELFPAAQKAFQTTPAIPGVF